MMIDKVPDFGPFHYHKWAQVPQSIEEGDDLTSFPLDKLNGLLVGSIRYMNDLAVFKKLISAGADIHSTQAIFHALQEGYPDYVELLLGLGVDPNVTSHDWGTPLVMAAEGGPVEIVRMLIKAGADVNRPDPDGVTPLVAVTQGLDMRLKTLERRGATTQQKEKLRDQHTKRANEVVGILTDAGATV